MTAKPHIQVDLTEQRLWRDGRAVDVTAKVFSLLRVFVENPEKLLTKTTILRQVWPGTHVSDASVKDCVKNLRITLQDDASDPVFIETVRGRGYRYLGGTELLPGGTSPDVTAATVPPPPPRTAARLWLVLSLIFATAVAASLWMQWRAPEIVTQDGAATLELGAEPTIAVLPFVNLSNNTDLDLFAGGLTEDLTTSLAQLPNIFVSARGAAKAASANQFDDGDIADALGVRYLLKGSIQREGDRLRISAQLVDSAAGGFVWTKQYERPTAEFFPIQDDIVLQTLTELRVQLDEGERVRAVKDTENLQSWLASGAAYGAFLEFSATGNRRARELWQEALDHDQTRAVPHAGLAFTHYYDAYRGWSADRNASIALGRGHAEIALKRNPDLPLAYQAMGALMLLQGQTKEGLMLRRRAVELAPNDFSAVGGLAAQLTRFGQAEEAVGLFRRAVRLNPSPPLWVPIWFGHALHLNHQPDEAADWIENALARSPNQAYLHARISAVYSDLGRQSEAREAAAAAVRLDPEFDLAKMWRIFPIEDAATRAWLGALLINAGIPA